MKLFSKNVVTQAYRVTQTLTGVECDVCHKIIPASRYSDATRYYEVTTGHRDWGNDSWESMETKDVCLNCIAGYVSDCLITASNTGYIELEPALSCSDEKNEKVVNKPPAEDDISKVSHDRW